MKRIHLTTYNLYKKDIKNDVSFIIISDLHFSKKVSDDKLNSIYMFIKKENPTYISFPGDIIDSLDDIEDKFELKRLTNWFKKLSSITKVIVSYGNHDFYTKVDDKLVKGNSKILFDSINSINNVYFLDNDIYNDEYINIIGYTEELAYYHELNNHKFKLGKENKKEKLKELKDLLNSISTNNNLTILLSHSPIYYNDECYLKELNSIDYIVSGHMHNGCMPPLLYEIWNTSRGIIAPTKEPFPLLARNTMKKSTDKLIVNGPLTMFHNMTGQLEKLNCIFPTYLTKLSVTNNIKYNTKKVNKKTKYYKY